MIRRTVTFPLSTPSVQACSHVPAGDMKCFGCLEGPLRRDFLSEPRYRQRNQGGGHLRRAARWPPNTRCMYSTGVYLSHESTPFWAAGVLHHAHGPSQNRRQRCLGALWHWNGKSALWRPWAIETRHVVLCMGGKLGYESIRDVDDRLAAYCVRTVTKRITSRCDISTPA